MHDRTAESASVSPRLASTSAEVFLQSLARLGVDTAFGIPGGTISSVYNALPSVPGIRHIAMRHECAAAFAAVGYARATGRPALLLTTSGPGITNALTGLATARYEQLPIILVAGEVALRARSRGAIQDGSEAGLSVHTLLAPVCRWVGTVQRADNAAGYAARAWTRAHGVPAGPVAVTFPLDVGGARATAPLISAPPPRLTGAPAHECAAVAKLLAQAKKPLLVLGNGARAAHRETLALAERLSLPTLVTGHGKGAFPERHPLYIGIMGLGQHRQVRAHLDQAPDVTLIVGSRLNDLATNGWSLPLDGTRATIQIDHDPMLLGCNANLTHALMGDAALTAQTILEALPDAGERPLRVVTSGNRPCARPDAQPVPAGQPDAAGDDQPSGQHAAMNPPQLLPGDLLKHLQQHFPGARWVSDIGEHLAHALYHLRVDSPEQFTTLLGYGSMGSGVCSAIGIKLAHPDAPVLCVCGDGGFTTYQAEILTCVENAIGVVFVVFNDGVWNMVEHGFRAVYGSRPVELISRVADLAASARAMGANAVTVSSLAELRQIPLAELVSDTVPLVIDARIDASQSLTRETRSASLKHFHGGTDNA